MRATTDFAVAEVGAAAAAGGVRGVTEAVTRVARRTAARRVDRCQGRLGAFSAVRVLVEGDGFEVKDGATVGGAIGRGVAFGRNDEEGRTLIRARATSFRSPAPRVASMAWSLRVVAS